MKNLTGFFYCSIMLLSIVLFLQKNSFATMYSISNTFSGSQQVPPNTSTGTATIVGTYNDVTNIISYTINFSGLLSNTTAGHFHGPAAVGVNAGVQIPYAGFPTGVRSGTYTQTNTLTAVHETELLANMWYGNIHTLVFGNGEIRAQIIPVVIKTLNLTVLIEGLYDNVNDTKVRDTVSVYIRETSSPFALVDLSDAYLSSNGNAVINFLNVVNGTNYYIQIIHRNSIETWSKFGNSFTSNALTYNFTTAATQAFGDNLVLKGTKYCDYSGDVNQDGAVDGSDGSIVDNDISNFVFGYVPSDVDGNDIVDGSDALIVDNNSANFVNKIVP